jgi:hypothetical protein
MNTQTLERPTTNLSAISDRRISGLQGDIASTTLLLQQIQDAYSENAKRLSILLRSTAFPRIGEC